MNNSTIASEYPARVFGDATGGILVALVCIYFIVCCCCVCICQYIRDNRHLRRTHSVAIVVLPDVAVVRPVIDGVSDVSECMVGIVIDGK